MIRRAYQEVGLRLFITLRTSVRFWARQTGKTTGFAEASLFEMMKYPRRLVTYATATLLLGRELIMKDSEVLQRAIVGMQHQAAHGSFKLELHDRERGDKDLTTELKPEDFTELFESKRLEFWLWHNRTTASRTQVIAPSVATARGWTGTVLWDEVGHTPDAGELYTALEPIVSSDPDFRLGMAGTPPEDDAHWSFELFNPPPGVEFPADAEGNQYENDFGIPVHRVTADDAAKAGKKTFHPITGEPITPNEARRLSPNREGWDRNHRLILRIGGTSAINALALKSAQELGQDRCLFVQINDDEDLDVALDWLRKNLGSGPVALGYDVATTEKETSNPSSLSVIEREWNEYPVKLCIVWKTADPDRAERIIDCVLDVIEERKEGGKARRLAIDATNERYNAQSLRKKLGRRVPVELVVSSETLTVPGQAEPMTWKAYLGHQFANAVEDGQVPLPADRYIRDDMRRVKKDRGSFTCELGPEGEHGDTFDSGKLALHGLSSKVGAITDASGIRTSASRPTSRIFMPRRLVRRPNFRRAA